MKLKPKIYQSRKINVINELIRPNKTINSKQTKNKELINQIKQTKNTELTGTKAVKPRRGREREPGAKKTLARRPLLRAGANTNTTRDGDAGRGVQVRTLYKKD